MFYSMFLIRCAMLVKSEGDPMPESPFSKLYV